MDAPALVMRVEGFGCQVCGAAELVESARFSALHRVTSDCFPFRPGGRLAVCGACGTAQKLPDDAWLRDIKEIYGRYRIYHQSGGVEQSVFDPVTSRPIRRSVVLAERLASATALPREGRLLDYGCGNGAMLAAFAAVRPGWSLSGVDLDDRNLERLEKIPGFERLYTDGLDGTSAEFDVITLAHSLEHVPAPLETLRALRRRLASHGRLFVQLPDLAETPFDLVVADHLCHFTPATLSRLVTRAGFAIEHLATDWVRKEISLVARPGAGADAGPPAERIAGGWVHDRVDWLHQVVETAERASGARPFGLFGTSVSGTWLFAHLAGRVEFFVDEDPARADGRHMGLPIFAPPRVPAGATVYVPLIPDIARAIATRLEPLGLRVHVPPCLAAAVPR